MLGNESEKPHNACSHSPQASRVVVDSLEKGQQAVSTSMLAGRKKSARMRVRVRVRVRACVPECVSE